jgi:hypothetical protein
MKKKKAPNGVKTAVAAVFGVALLVLLVMAKYNNKDGGMGAIKAKGKKGGSALLRRAVQQMEDDAKDKEQDDVAGDDDSDSPEEPNKAEQGAAIASLPPNSVYRLSVEDLYGDMVYLSKYIGMVTLIVNVACL